ncbi:putative Ig domain-containing protein [Cryobacterium melibiosiphilum]|nr:putative Ig domain-containing protein [Cryobacterium melibiosiphilum]
MSRHLPFFRPPTSLRTARAKLLTGLGMVLALVATSFVVVSPAMADTKTFAGGTFTYTVASGATTITAFAPATGVTAITIPDKLGGKPVTAIGKSAFKSKGLTAVGFPSTVTSIGETAFLLNKLTAVTLPTGLTEIAFGAFANNNIESVTIPSGVATLGGYAFSQNDLTSVSVAEGVTNIGEYAFFDNLLTSVVLPSGLTTIGEHAFALNSLTTLDIPAAITVIEASAFEMNSLTTLTIPAGVTAIKTAAFASNRLTSVSLPSGLTTLGDRALHNNSLIEVLIPASVTSMGEWALASNPLTSVTFEGAAPTTFVAAVDGSGSLGRAVNPTTLVALTVYYSNGAAGFEAPTWKGYRSAVYVDPSAIVAPVFTADSPAETAATGAAYSYTFTASGSPAPTFAVSAGTLPAGLTLDATTGILSGTPTATGSSTFTVTASNEIEPAATGASHTITVYATPVFTADAPPLTATQGTEYAGYTFAATGSPAPLFAVTTGIEHTIVLSVPVAPDFTTDQPALDATVGTDYSYTFTASGFPTPTFTSTTLPAGWTLSSDGVLSALPTTAETITVTVTASNGVGADAVGQPHTITVTPALAAPVFTADSPTLTATASTPYLSYEFAASGYPAPTFDLAWGALPTGLTLSTDGLLSGTPTGAGGLYSFTVQASNSVARNVTGTSHLLILATSPILGTDTPPNVATVGTAYAGFTFTATGYPNPTFTVTSGVLPAGLTLTESGVLAGTPTGLGGEYTFRVAARNTAGLSAAGTLHTIIVSAAPILTADAPTPATVGAAYTYTYAATGFPAPTFSVTGTLPAGLTLSEEGVLSGTPTGTGGISDFTVTAVNAAGSDASASTITVAAAPVFTADAPTTTATVGTAYSYTFAATGYPAPTFTSAGLPEGLTLSSTGVLSGTPTGTGGVTRFAVTAGNSVTLVDGGIHSITVNAAPILTADAPTPDGTIGTAYSYIYAATGYPAPTFTVIGGVLPAGLTLSADGVLSGTPTGAGGVSSDFTVTASNGVGSPAIGSAHSITVAEASALTADAPPTPAVGVAYSYTFTASGFPTPTFAVTGTLPAGLTLTEDGVLAGTPTTAGSSTFTVTASNGVDPDAVGTTHTLAIAVPAAALKLGFAVGAKISGATTTATAVGLQAGSAWTVQVFSTPQLLANGTVGISGAVTSPVTLPSNLAAGSHHLLFTGVSASGAALTATAWFQVNAQGLVTAISLTGPTSAPATAAAALSDTGANADIALNLALLALLLGAGLLLARRRTQPTRSIR